jgi:hypothetical protein
MALFQVEEEHAAMVWLPPAELRATPPPPPVRQTRVRLVLPSMEPDKQWCLRACTAASCQLPSGFPAKLGNAHFSQPCPQDESSMWFNVTRASGYVQWVNVATQKCLSLKQENLLDYSGELASKLLCVQGCRNAICMSARDDDPYRGSMTHSTIAASHA